MKFYQHVSHALFRVLSTGIGVAGIWSVTEAHPIDAIAFGFISLVFLSYGFFKIDLIDFVTKCLQSVVNFLRP